jgi:hypothetical protein
VNVLEAVERLRRVGSSEDPVYHRSHWTTPEDLLDVLDWESSAQSIVIVFYGRTRRIKGSLRLMVKERES